MEPLKGVSAGQSREHQRNWSEGAWKEALSRGNFDRAREHLNFEIVDGKVQAVDKTKSIAQRLAENLAARGIKDPNEGLAEPKFRTIGDFIFSGSHDRMTEIAFGDQPVVIAPGNNLSNLNIHRTPEAEQWAMDVYNFVAGKFGKENIVSFYVHLDETTMHAHVAVVPVTPMGKISFKQVFAGKDKNEFKQRMRTLHDQFYNEVNRHWGMERGTSLTNENSRHYQPQEFRRMLEDDSRQKELELAEMEQQLSYTNHKLRMAEKAVKGLTSMIEHLQEKKDDIEKELAELRRKLKNDAGDHDALVKEIEEHEANLKEVEDKLAEKISNLEDAKAKLADAQAAMEKVQGQKELVKQEADKLSKEVYSDSGIMLRTALLDSILMEYPKMVAKLPKDAVNPFTDSTLELVVQRGAQVLQCARLLAAGLIADATTFAEGNGGGGGGSDLKWGRDDDEDDRHWRMRCVAMACHMMKPATRGRKR